MIHKFLNFCQTCRDTLENSVEQMGWSYLLNLFFRRLLILFPEVVLLALAVVAVVIVVSGPFLMLFVVVPLALFAELVGRLVVPVAPSLPQKMTCANRQISSCGFQLLRRFLEIISQ